LFVQVTAPQELCVRRVQARKAGENLNNDQQFTRDFYDYWTQKVAPQYSFDLIVENRDEHCDEIIAAIGQGLSSADAPA
jgi:hypothetical protein